MATSKTNQKQSAQVQQGLRQIVRIEQANLLQMPEEEFQRFIIEIEQSSFFLKLYRKEKIINYQRFPKTNISSSFYQYNEEMAADSGSLDIESLLLNKEHMINQIKRLGLEKFKMYFLFPEEGMTLEEISRECKLDVLEIQEINSLIDEFSIMSEFYHPSNLTSGVIRYSKIASVGIEAEGFIIHYFSPSYARGRYSINYKRFEDLNARGVFSRAESREAKQLFKKLELINNCKDTINLILQSTIKKQSLYLESGNSRSLLPFSQKELANQIGLAPSSVSRAIRGKSIDTPLGEEISLSHFFPRPKKFRKELIKQLLETCSGFPSDETMRTILWRKYGVAISRRSVANLRKELKLPTTEKTIARGRRKE